jgi:methenyltetrahydromethanopterin cyclohydrolase
LISLNESAHAVVQRLISEAGALQVLVTELDNGATVVDTGVETIGSYEAGRLFSEACLAGLAGVRLCQVDAAGLALPGVEVSVQQPVLACMASQYAGWSVDVPATGSSRSFFAMGSGPARALHRREPIFDVIDYRDTGSVAVLALESSRLPSAQVAEWVAARCGVTPARLYLLVAPTASLVGSVQIAARIVETGLHKMHEVGFAALGRTNDAVLYGGRAWYTVRTDDAAIEGVIHRLPSSASADYGVPFGELFRRHGGDFYKIDPLLFSPAEISLTNAASGRTFHAGGIDAAVLRASLLT